MKKEVIFKIIIAALVFWVLDFVLHFTGVGETHYYYFVKMANALLFASIWFLIFDKNSRTKKFLFSVFFGTWISFFYLVSSYSGLVQWFGIEANYGAPPFVIFGIFLTKYLWWVWHILSFYIGLEVSELVTKKR